MSDKDSYYIDLEDEVVRESIILRNGKLLWPPPPLKETFNDFQFAFTKFKANKRAKHSINEELY
jgi:hypothetical protein